LQKINVTYQESFVSMTDHQDFLYTRTHNSFCERPRTQDSLHSKSVRIKTDYLQTASIFD